MNDFPVKDIVIIGAGESGTAFLKEVSESGSNITVKIIDQKNFYFPKDKISNDPLNFAESKKTEEVAARFNADFIPARAERVTLRKKKIYLNEGETVDFDRLVAATGAAAKKNEIKGVQKEGFFYLFRIDPYRLKDSLKLYDEATVYIETLEGIKFSLFLKSLGKEVTAISPDLSFLGGEEEKVAGIFANKGINFYSRHIVDEVIGDKQVKAVKIKEREKEEAESGGNSASSIPMKIFSSQLVFADIRLRPNTGFINSSEINWQDYGLFAGCGNIYKIGDASHAGIADQKCYSGNRIRAQKSGEALAAHILGKKSCEDGFVAQDCRIDREIQQICKGIL